MVVYRFFFIVGVFSYKVVVAGRRWVITGGP